MKPLKFAVMAAFLLLPVALTGCKTPAVITGIDSDSVEVQQNMFSPIEDVYDEARRGCAFYNREPVALSVREAADYTRIHLFACRIP